MKWWNHPPTPIAGVRGAKLEVAAACRLQPRARQRLGSRPRSGLKWSRQPLERTMWSAAFMRFVSHSGDGAQPWGGKRDAEAVGGKDGPSPARRGRATADKWGGMVTTHHPPAGLRLRASNVQR